MLTLHGFLGLPSDWDLWKEEGWKTPSLSSVKWEGEVAMGYSLGGRRLLHALFHGFFQPKKVIFISTHTGLKKEERQERKERDARWAARFLHDPWEEVVADWNSQQTLANDPLIAPRLEEQFDRKELARQLTEWSLGEQEDLAPFLSSLFIPILWIVGERDERLVYQGKNLKFRHPASKIWVAEGAFHRVPWAKPKEFNQQIKGWLYGVDHS